MSVEIEIEITQMRYDVTMPLIDGRVTLDGIKLVPTRAAPPGTIIGAENPIPRGDFGLVDLNMGNWLPGVAAGWDIAPLPVFSKRKHVYTYLFCRSDIGIDGPRDLEGRRVLTMIGGSSVAIWLRGLLAHRHGVDLGKITWVSFREEWPCRNANWRVEILPQRKSVVEALLDGDVDATMVDVSDRGLWSTLESHPRIKRLFPDYLGEAKRFFDETGIYAPVHMMVLSGKLDRQYPDLAGRLLAAFDRAREIAFEDVLSDRSGAGLIDLRERSLAQETSWGDLFRNGIATNIPALDRFATHCFEHGLIDRIEPHEAVFASSTLKS